MRRAAMVIVVWAVIAAPAAAQFVVIDPANLAQAILIADRTLREYNTLLQQYETILKMARSLGSLDRYRTPSIAITGHDPSRWQEFRRRYQSEIRQHPDQFDRLRMLAQHGWITLVFSAHDEAHNDAVVLKDLLVGRA